MAGPVPILDCAVSVEAYNANNEVTKRENFKKVSLEITIRSNIFLNLVCTIYYLIHVGAF